MREILANLDLLKDTVLDLRELQLDGIPFGASTAQFPRHKITSVTLSPIVACSRFRTDIGSEYFDSSERRLSLDEVIDSVIDSNGIVHFASKISFKIRAGQIVGFALYSEALSHFGYLKTYDDFGTAFDVADRVVPSFGYGELMGHDHYYFGSRKHVAWCEVFFRVTLLNLGEYEGNDGPPITA